MIKILIPVIAVLILGIVFLVSSGPDQAGPSPSVTVTSTPQALPGTSPKTNPPPSATATPAATPTPAKTTAPKPTPTPTAAPAPGQHSVSIQNFAFSVPALTVKRGDTVRFTNKDSATHTSTAVNGEWDSGSLRRDEAFTLDTSTLAPGTYNYRCTPHPFMTATLTVQ